MADSGHLTFLPQPQVIKIVVAALDDILDWHRWKKAQRVAEGKKKESGKKQGGKKESREIGEGATEKLSAWQQLRHGNLHLRGEEKPYPELVSVLSSACTFSQY